MSVGFIAVSESILTVKVHVIFVIFVAVFILAYQGTQFDIILPEGRKNIFEYTYFTFCYFVIKISTDYLIYLKSLNRVPVIPPFALIILNSVFNLSKASNFDILQPYYKHLEQLHAPELRKYHEYSRAGNITHELNLLQKQK